MNAIIEQKIDRSAIFQLQHLAEKLPDDAKRMLDVFHHFSHGIYCRELHIPADTIAVGQLHKYPQLNILLSGKIRVSDGFDAPVDIEAPYFVCSPAGTKRLVYAHTDCVWLTIHGTHETDLDKIENEFIAKTEQDYLDHCKQLHLPGI